MVHENVIYNDIKTELKKLVSCNLDVTGKECCLLSTLITGLGKGKYVVMGNCIYSSRWPSEWVEKAHLCSLVV